MENAFRHADDRDNNTLPVTDIGSAGFKQVSILNPAAVWSINATQLRIAGGNETAEENEDWAISKLLYLNNVAPDVAIPIKNVTQNSTTFEYVYSQPGNYKVVFLAANANGDKQENTMKTVEINIQ